MILTEDQIKDIILNNPNKGVVKSGRDMSATLVKYITGEGLKDSMESLPYFEKDELTKIRKKLTRTTRDLFERLFQPLEKVFTAKGGVTNYGLTTESESRFAKIMASVRKGMSMDEWMQQVALKAYLLDPMALLYTEIDAVGNSYPTYKSTSYIYDYELNGRKPEYVVFMLKDSEVKAIVSAGKVDQPKKGETLYRVVDDAFDMYVLKNGRQVSVAYKIQNYFKYVPGQIASDITVFGTDILESPVQPTMELAADFFNDNSSKSLFKKYQMHLKEWGIAIDCKRCGGEGQSGGTTCDACGGSGMHRSVKVAEKINIQVSEDGTAKTPIPPGGYIAPPTESWLMINQELTSLKQDMSDTFWETSSTVRTTGMNDTNQSKDPTATEMVYSDRSKEPKLKKFSKWAQGVHKFQVDNIKKVFFRNVNMNESTITYGDRYLLESPDELMAKYEEWKAKGASYPVLDKALLEVLEAKYSADQTELRRQQILMRLEPYVHHSIDVVLAWPWLPDSIKMRKAFFNEWLNNTDPMVFYMSSEEKIKASLDAYIAEHGEIVKPEPKEPALMP